MHRARLLLAVAAVTLLPAAAAQGAAAPGRVAYPLSPLATFDDEEVPAVSTAMATVDGGVVTAGGAGANGGVVLARLRGDGRLERSFGVRGLAPLPRGLTSSVTPRQVLPGPGDTTYVITRGPAKAATWALLVTRVLRDGKVDAAFGSGGSVVAGVDESPAAGAAVAPDGSIVVAGSLSLPNPSGGEPTAALQRFTPTGAPDPSFGVDGIVRLSTRPAGPVALLPDGAVAVAVQRADVEAQLLVLRPDGSADPAFNGGRPRDLGGAAVGGIVARADGSMDVLVTASLPAQARLLRVRRDGSLDPAFGTAGVLELHPALTQLTAGASGAELVSAAAPTNGSELRVARVMADGRPDPAWGGANGRVLQLGFGGGIFAWPWARQRDPLRQHGARTGVVVPRPDGGLLVAASVQVDAYSSGGGLAAVHREVGVAAYGSDLRPVRAWGSPATEARLSLRLPRVSARAIARSGDPRLRLAMTTSTAGIVRIEVLARGRVVARTFAKATGVRRQPAWASLTPYGRRTIGRLGGARVTLRGRMRDVVGATARTTAHARLR